MPDQQATGNYVNTAVADMMDFFNFIESDTVTDTLWKEALSLSLMHPIRDLTGLENSSRYRYRSMAEAMVLFSQESNGAYGISGMSVVPNASGGGTTEMVEKAIEPIEGVDIQYGKEQQEE